MLNFHRCYRNEGNFGHINYEQIADAIVLECITVNIHRWVVIEEKVCESWDTTESVASNACDGIVLEVDCFELRKSREYVVRNFGYLVVAEIAARNKKKDIKAIKGVQTLQLRTKESQNTRWW